MEKEKILQQFETIENKVEELVRSCEALKAENQELKTQLSRLNEDFQEKVEAEERYNEVREQIRNRVDSLLTRLEGATQEKSPED